MTWNQYLMYSDDPSDSGTWISGIYKVRSYSDGRFLAYYMRDSDRNWGWNVSEPPIKEGHCRYWPTLEAAQKACEDHALTYSPEKRTIRRAQEVVATFTAITS